jgi:hypothetical protein
MRPGSNERFPVIPYESEQYGFREVPLVDDDALLDTHVSETVQINGKHGNEMTDIRPSSWIWPRKVLFRISREWTVLAY